MLCATLALGLTTTSVSAVQAQNQGHWNQFRGPNGDGKTLWLKHREVDSDLGDVLKAEGLSKADIEETKKEKPGDNRKAYATPTVIVDDLLCMVSDQGYASCLEAKTGRELWKERLREGGDHWASPLYADGKVHFCGKKGVVSVIAAARDFELLARNRFAASFIASPAVAGDALILRSLTHVYCIAE